MDRTLGGGIPRGHLTLVYGEAGSGKTTLALQTAVRAASKGFKTIYIDSDERLSPIRLLQVAEELNRERLQGVLVLKPGSFNEQTYLLERLERYMSRGVSLVVLDSATRLYRVELSRVRDPFGLNRELNRQMAYLSKLAKSFNLAVMLTSQVRALQGRSIEPVAYRVLRFWSSVILQMKLTGKPDLRHLTVEKNNLTGKKATLILRITAKGIEEV